MDTHLKDYKLGDLRIELTAQEADGCQMLLTAKSRNNKVLWRTYITNEYGLPKTFQSIAEALADVDSRMKALAWIIRRQSKSYILHPARSALKYLGSSVTETVTLKAYLS